MKNVSFGSTYAVPLDNTQNPMVKNYVKFMTETATMRDKSQQSKYNPKDDVYYVYIRDENDKKFEDYASRYGIHYRKANQTELDNAVTILKKDSPADNELRFLAQAITMGMKYDVAQNGNIQNVTLYDDKREKVFAKYTIDKSKEYGGKLIQKEEMLDEKVDCIHEYDDDGKFKRSVMIYGDNSKLEFIYDENGKPRIKK